MATKFIQVSEDFRKSAIAMIEKIIADKEVVHTVRDADNNSWIEEYTIPGTDIKVIFWNFRQNAPTMCDLSIKGEGIRTAITEEVNKIFTAFRKRYQEQNNSKHAAKEQELLDILKGYMAKGK